VRSRSRDRVHSLGAPLADTYRDPTNHLSIHHSVYQSRLLASKLGVCVCVYKVWVLAFDTISRSALDATTLVLRQAAVTLPIAPHRIASHIMALVPDPSASRHAILHIATNHIRFEVGLDGTNAPSSVLNTFEIPPAPAFILAILFLFVAVVCFFKEVLPQLLLRWDRYRQKPGSNYHKIVSLRILWFFSNVLLSATGTCRARMTPRVSRGSALTKLPLPSIHPSVRTVFFLAIAICGPTLLNKPIPLWLYYLLWFVPELATISAYTTLVYFWYVRLSFVSSLVPSLTPY